MARQREDEERQREEERLSMSAVMRKGLPRPTIINRDMFKSEDEVTSRVEKMINEEMLVLMVHDNAKYPLKGMKASKLPELGRRKT
mmetsp:Transcript_23269/g.27309  ORF Transcript_23269/g.27309 Transcript_23269/m.27309 type:complete len:86 (+) Transcript_23269:909-1166(+)